MARSHGWPSRGARLAVAGCRAREPAVRGRREPVDGAGPRGRRQRRAGWPARTAGRRGVHGWPSRGAVLASPRCEVVESLLTEQDLVVVASAEPDGPLARLAVAG